MGVIDGGPPPRAARVVAALDGDVPARVLAEYRAAGQIVYRELDEAERLRRQLLGRGTPPRRFPAATSGRLLCLWNAFVLQALGEYLLDAGRAAGVVPAAFAQYAVAAFAQVDPWLSRARQAAIDGRHRIGEHVRVPAELPSFSGAGPCPLACLEAMVAAGQLIHARAKMTFTDIARLGGGDVPRLRWLLAQAPASLDSAREMWSGTGEERPGLAHMHVRHGLASLYEFGQSAAMPAAFDAPDRTVAVSLTARPPADLDPWSLTDPYQRRLWRADPRARAALEKMWADDPNVPATLGIQAQIDAALGAELIGFATARSGERLGSFHRRPWAAIYEVRRPLVLAGRRLWPLQHFTYDISTGPVPFARRIAVSGFRPAGGVDYGNTA